MTAKEATIPRERVEETLGRFRGQRVLVVGDVMLDRYLWGTVTRISPEAPVPVVAVSGETVRLGGAANVAGNIRSMSGEPLLIGVVGKDRTAEELAGALDGQGIPSDMLVVDRNRRTTQKTRIIAHHQQVVRADQEDTIPLDPAATALLQSQVESALAAKPGAMIISDYGKGVISRELLVPVLERAKALGVPVCVDPKESHFDAYQQASVITPNLIEAGNAYGRRIENEASLEEVGFGLLERLGCPAVLITRGEQGMSLFQAPRQHTHFPTVAQDVYDVTGAGDTVVAAFAMALAAGADPQVAAHISNHAAGLVIRELGTASTTVAAVLGSFARNGW
jgi:D-beta-D-heptose 7-phosphate kinase/D-beta-D-heptose 1-phosphate adenosyltransferase